MKTKLTAMFVAALVLVATIFAGAVYGWHPETSGAPCVDGKQNVEVKVGNPDEDWTQGHVMYIVSDVQFSPNPVPRGVTAKATIERKPGPYQVNGTISWDNLATDVVEQIETQPFQLNLEVPQCVPTEKAPSIQMSLVADCTKLTAIVEASDGDTYTDYTISDGRSYEVSTFIFPKEKHFHEMPINPGETVTVSLGSKNKGGSETITAPSKEDCAVPAPVPTTPVMSHTPPACDLLQFRVDIFGNLGDSPQEFSLWDGRNAIYIDTVDPGKTWSITLNIKPGELVRLNLRFGANSVIQEVQAPSQAECHPTTLVSQPVPPTTIPTVILEPQPNVTRPEAQLPQQPVVLAHTGRNHAPFVVTGVILAFIGVMALLVERRYKILAPAKLK